MTINGWIKILIFCAITLLPVKPLGACLTGVGSGGRTALSPLLRPVARSLSRASGISGNEVRHWSSCAVALLIAMLRLQDALAHNPAGQRAGGGRRPTGRVARLAGSDDEKVRLRAISWLASAVRQR